MLRQNTSSPYILVSFVEDTVPLEMPFGLTVTYANTNSCRLRISYSLFTHSFDEICSPKLWLCRWSYVQDVEGWVTLEMPGLQSLIKQEVISLLPCGGEAHCRGGHPLELVLHHCWLLLSHDYTSFRLTILINPRRSLIYYSWVHCNALQGYRWWRWWWCIIPSIERCDCRRRLYCSFRVSLF